ncbi:MAG: hypothetical protein R2853_20485 [Thermomicrobiales bacterium]
MRAPVLSGISRRASLLSLGAIGLTALTPRRSAAKKKKANSRCKKQIAECRTSFALVCSGDNCPAAIACCDLLSDCNFTAFASCALAATDDSDSV